MNEQLITDTPLRQLFMAELLDTARNGATPAEVNKIKLVLSHPSERFQHLWEAAIEHMVFVQQEAEAVLLNAALYGEYPGDGEA